MHALHALQGLSTATKELLMRPQGTCSVCAPRCKGTVRAGRSQKGGLSPGVGQAMPSSTLPLAAGAPASSLTAGAGVAAAASVSKTTCRSWPAGTWGLGWHEREDKGRAAAPPQAARPAACSAPAAAHGSPQGGAQPGRRRCRLTSRSLSVPAVDGRGASLRCSAARSSGKQPRRICAAPGARRCSVAPSSSGIGVPAVTQ